MIENPEIIEQQEQDREDPRPVFTRSPRNYKKYPQGEIKLMPPPAKPNAPTTPLLSLFVPIIGVWLSAMIQIFAAQSAGGTGRIPVYAFVSIPMALITVIFGIVNGRSSRNKYKADLAKRIKVYDDYLTKQRGEINQWIQEQREAMLTPNPDLEGCVVRAQEGVRLAGGRIEAEKSNDQPAGQPALLALEKEQRLWEREPAHHDFLHLRLGLGSVVRSFTVERPPTPPLSLEEDDLIEKGYQLEEECRLIPGLPILLPLGQVGSAGIVGANSHQRNKLVQSLIMQLTAHHAPNNVKIVLVINEHDRKKWLWVRRLPHNWNENNTVRYFLMGRRKKGGVGTTEVTTEDPNEVRHTVLAELESMLHIRQHEAEQNHSDETPIQPVSYVFIFADRSLWNGSAALQYAPLLDLLLSKGPAIGAYSIFLAGHRSQIPKDVRTLIHLKEGEQAKLVGDMEIIGQVPEVHRFEPMLAKEDQVNLLTDALAQLHIENLAAQAPTQVTLIDLLMTNAVKEVNLELLRKVSCPWESLQIPIGKKANGETAYLNLQDASKHGGFGVHAMVGGTTGTGKTKFLQTLILLTCAYYKPEDVNFVLIDYKGGDLAKGLEHLPHLVGSLANMDSQGKQGELIQRLFSAFDAEIQRRKDILKGDDINSYMSRYHTGTETRALPHLFIVIDEFAEMLLRNPTNDPNKSLMKRLMSIAAIGRSIGMHLILATQNPGTVITEDMRNNINTRICLRMGTRDASKAILNRNDAYDNITKDQVGRGYLQVGNNDQFDLVQFAWGGSLDIPRNMVQVGGVSRVTYQGVRIKHKKLDTSGYKSTQLEALAGIIASDKGASPQIPVWLPALPPLLELCDLREQAGWDGHGWKPLERHLKPVLGRIDNPARRAQPLLEMNLGKEGHLLLHGGPVTGKTTLLQTLVTSTMLDHTPAEVQFYIVEYGVQTLKKLEGFPHIGAAIMGSTEGERVRRVFTLLKDLLESRRKLLDAPNVVEYRRQHPEQVMPDVFLIIDNFTSFMEGKQPGCLEFELLKAIASDGPSLGIHLILTTVSANFPQALREKISNVVALEMPGNNYLDNIGRTGGVLPATDIPGRGIVRMGNVVEFQVARMGPKPTEAKTKDGEVVRELLTEAQRMEWLEQLMRAMRCAVGDFPVACLPIRVPPMHEEIHLEELVRHFTERDVNYLPVPVGIDMTDPTLNPRLTDFSVSQHLFVMGPPLSGRTTFVRNLIASMMAIYNPEEVQFIIFDLDSTGLYQLDQNNPFIAGTFTEIGVGFNLEEAIDQRLTSVQIMPATDSGSISPAFLPVDGGGEMMSGQQVSAERLIKQPEIVIVMDDFGVVKSKLKDDQRNYLVNLAKSNRRVHIILVGTGQEIASTSPLESLVRKGKTGFALAFSENDWSVAVSMAIAKPSEVRKVGDVGSGYHYIRGAVRAFINFPGDAIQSVGSVENWINLHVKKRGFTYNNQ
ncbi:DNA segregation ATPase FtsK/SpoIIIE [Longilinea arvoryzae]|uniref:DNA segregation ATPase FtsK/SpoIIIE n=1 Tax=Longilinea arvoryzae TaxID=360412 RepID=A0A0S7BE49_9CHLR|nr:FtsK/SpoIIIE domain-containing protein [Longilinea arvoryzae]GAP13184.1 DNA segregation ATPase FtsK/SpoIIIE [Longilinea arvoryzae]